MRIGLRHKRDGRFFPLNEKGETVIGQSEASNLVLDDDGVAPQHAKVRITALGIEIDDLGAPQRTLVNDYPITKHFLSQNDQVRMGAATLVLELFAEDGPPLPRCRRCGCEVQKSALPVGSASGVRCDSCASRPASQKGTSRRVPRATPEPASKPPSKDDFDPIDSDPGAVKTKRYTVGKPTDPQIPIPVLPGLAGEPGEPREPGALDRELVPDYVPVGVLGEGSQGRVFKLRHKTTGQIVAGKLVWSANAKSIARLEREIEALKRLQHPAIVALHEVRKGPSGSMLVLMEYVEGPSLGTMIKRVGSLEPRRVLVLAARLAEGLAYAATRKVVHRDVKPSNVLVGPADAPKLVDFGLVTFGDRETRLTVEGQWIGTPHYMAPEQMGGGQADARTDTWGLAVTAYHAITGKLPYDATSPGDLYRKVLSDPIDLGQLVALTGPKAGPVFERLLAKRIEDRLSPAEAAVELAKLASGKA